MPADNEEAFPSSYQFIRIISIIFHVGILFYFSLFSMIHQKQKKNRRDWQKLA